MDSAYPWQSSRRVRVRSASGSTMKVGSWAPQRSWETKGPSKWMPASSSAFASSARVFARARSTSAEAVTQEATKEVVP